MIIFHKSRFGQVVIIPYHSFLSICEMLKMHPKHGTVYFSDGTTHNINFYLGFNSAESKLEEVEESLR
jgi:hypothetical protein